MKKITLLITLFMITAIESYSQCINTDQFPSATVVSNNSGLVQSIAANSFTSEFARLSNMSVGRDYKFNCQLQGVDNYITVTDLEDVVIASGDSPLTVTAITATDIRVHFSDDASCTASSVNHVTSFQIVLPCPVPVNSIVDNITTTTAGFTWENGGTETAWEVLVLQASENEPTATTTGTAVNNNLQFLANGLIPGTNYQFYVRANCVNEYSPWSASLNFTTLCLAQTTLPWFENFDSLVTGTNLFPNCWGFLNNTGNWSISAFPAPAYSGANMLRRTFNTDGWVFTPTTTLNAGISYSFSHFIKTNDNTVGYDISVAVGEGQTEVDMTNVLSEVTGYAGAGWTKFTYQFTPSTTGNYSFGTHVVETSGAPNGINFDDFKIQITPTCIEPTELANADVTKNSALITWTASTTTPSNGYQYYLATNAIAPTVASLPTGSIAAGITSIDLSSLVPGTSYCLWVRSNCGASDFSDWSTSTCFNTLVANDNFDEAIDITCGITYNNNTLTATLDEDDAPDGFGADMDARNVWYKYTGSGTPETVTLNLCNSSYDTSVLVYKGVQGSLELVIANDDDNSCGIEFTTRSRLNFNTDGTSIYYIAVEGFNEASFGAFTMMVTCGAIIPPAVANQNCDSSLAVALDDTYITSDNSYGDVSPTQTSCDTFGSIQDVWFSFVAPAAGSVFCRVGNGSMSSANFTVYSGTCGNLTEITSACNSNITIADDGAAATEEITGLIEGDTYFVQVWSTLGEQGTFYLKMSDAPLTTSGFDAANFEAYPNPVIDVLNLSYNKNITNVAVYNLLGQEVIAKALNSNQSQIDMSNLSRGTYLVKVNADNQVKTIKVIKE